MDAFIIAQNAQGDEETLTTVTVTIEYRVTEGETSEDVDLSEDTVINGQTWAQLKSFGALDADFKQESFYTDLNGRDAVLFDLLLALQ